MEDKDIEVLKKKVKESLDIDRHSLVMKFPFIGGISLKMNLVPTRDALNPTACTDGKNIFFDCAFYTDLSPKERIFVLGHEIWHCVMLHLARKQTRDESLWNIATDMEVNHLLEINSKDGLLSPPRSLLFPPPKYAGKSAEFLYDMLLNQLKSKSKSTNGKNTSGSISNGSGDNSDEFSNNVFIKKSKGAKSDNAEKLSGQFDKHNYVDDESLSKQSSSASSGSLDNEGNSSQTSKDGYPSRTDKYGDVGRDEDFQPKVSKDFAEEMRETVIEQAQQCERQQGTLPAGIESILEKLEKPEIPWHEVLSQFVTMCYNGRRRWNPPSRRHLYNEMYFQSRRDEKIKVAVAIDTSGSCVQDLPKFFSELISLIKSFGSYELHLIECDYNVDKYELYDDGKPFDAEKANDIEWSGGGGTSFKPPFKYLEKHNITPDCFVYLTDAYGDAPEYPPPYPVLWVLTSDGNTDFCNWGQKIRFKSAS